ncbi:MAG: hypothetical protein U0798_00650 [Gemmataceae bacterium]
MNPISALLSLLAWIGVWFFWLETTRNHHPTTSLALIVTTSLVLAYAIAAYLNHLVLLPRFGKRGHWLTYAMLLLGSMVALTAAALAVIRVSYERIWGPDADPYGVFKHFAIDLFGMAVHLIAAAFVVFVYRRVRTWRS